MAKTIKAVTVTTLDGDTLTYRNVSRVFNNAAHTITIMKGSNVPAVVKGLPFARVRYTY